MALLLAFSMSGLFAFAGLATDINLFWTVKRRMQTAADAAAVAAAISVRNSGSYTSAGRDVSSFNGFTDGSGGVTVAVNNPPTAGSRVADTDYTEGSASW